ncbi:hypothetical protein FRB94_010230 [Tulasnella sp. JGI-2019a]|nr:hypothetical protein FRB94_010230 [Tulasnella sp. JGI-2019a]
MLLATSCSRTLRQTRTCLQPCASWTPCLRSSFATVVEVGHCGADLDSVTLDPSGLQRAPAVQLSRNLSATVLPRAHKHAATTDLSRSAQQSYSEKTINGLIRCGSVQEALEMYQEQLRPGNNTPSISVTSHLLRALGKAPISPRRQQKGIDTIIGAIEHHNVSWDSGLLATFLSNLVDAGRYDELEQVVDTYSKTIIGEKKRRNWKPSGVICSIMIKGHCQAGRMQDAVRWLQRYRKDSKHPKSGHQLHSHPYISLMRGLAYRHKPFTDPRPCYTIFQQMLTDKTPLHVVVFNILMALEARRMNTRRVLALYRILQRSRGPQTLKPDATTFATLFAAHKAWRPTRLRQRRPSPTPREIFQTMLRLHHDHTGGRPRYRSPYLTASTLNVAISCFLQAKDYAAATVALRTFGVCRLVPTTRTEWVVSSPIMRRMTWNLGKNEEDMQYGEWVERMRGRVMDARERKDEMEEIKEFIKMLKSRSQHTAKLLPPGEIAAAHLAMDSLTGDNGAGRRGTQLEKILQKRMGIRSGPQASQINVRRLIKLVQQAMFATFPMGINNERKFGAIMASVNSEILPLRSATRQLIPESMSDIKAPLRDVALS